MKILLFLYRVNKYLLAVPVSFMVGNFVVRELLRCAQYGEVVCGNMVYNIQVQFGLAVYFYIIPATLLLLAVFAILHLIVRKSPDVAAMRISKKVLVVIILVMLILPYILNNFLGIYL